VGGIPPAAAPPACQGLLTSGIAGPAPAGQGPTARRRGTFAGLADLGRHPGFKPGETSPAGSPGISRYEGLEQQRNGQWRCEPKRLGLDRWFCGSHRDLLAVAAKMAMMVITESERELASLHGLLRVCCRIGRLIVVLTSQAGPDTPGFLRQRFLLADWPSREAARPGSASLRRVCSRGGAEQLASRPDDVFAGWRGGAIAGVAAQWRKAW
jgi:hypothetical protein